MAKSDWHEFEARLKRIQPEAEDIRFEVCHCKDKKTMLSYRLPSMEKPDPSEDTEACGFWCAGCTFSNAGARPVIRDLFSVDFDAIRQTMDERVERLYGEE